MNIEHISQNDAVNDWAVMSNKPMLGTVITLTIENEAGKESYEGTVLDYDESGEFALVWWHESGTRDYRYIHSGYDAQMNETMEW